MGADPFSWAAAGLTAANTVSGLAAGDAQRKAAQESRDQARRVAEQNAARIEKKTARQRQELAQEYRRAQSGANVALAGSGISAGSGSALERLAGTAERRARDLEDLEYEGALKAQQARYGARTATTVDSSSSARARAANSLLSLGSRAWKGGRFDL